MVIVYHNKNFFELQFKQPDEIPQDDLEKVAEIAINDLKTAFKLTNHIDHSWTENEKVTPLKNNPRSTSLLAMLWKSRISFT